MTKKMKSKTRLTKEEIGLIIDALTSFKNLMETYDHPAEYWGARINSIDQCIVKLRAMKDQPEFLSGTVYVTVGR